jgi:hypothetical protein
VAGIAGSFDLTLVIAGVWYHGSPWCTGVDCLSLLFLRGNGPTASFPQDTARAARAAAGIKCPASMINAGINDQ